MKQVKPLKKNSYKSKLAIVFFLLILLLPSQLGKHFFLPFSYVSGVRVDYLAPTLYLWDLLFIAILPFYFSKILTLFTNKRFLVLVVVFTLSVLLSTNKVVSLIYVLRLTEVGLFGYLFFLFLKTEKQKGLALFFQATGVGAIFSLLLGIVQFMTRQSVGGIFYFLGERSFMLSTPGIAKASFQGFEFLRPYATFSHPNSLGGFYLFIYVISSRYKKTFLSFLSICLILLSFSKLAIAGLVISILIETILSNKNTFCLPCKFSKIVVLLTISLVFFQVTSDPTTFIKRISLMNDSLKLIKSHVLFGVGPGMYVKAAEQFPTRFPDLLNQPVHSIFLLSVAEFGSIPFLILFVVAFPLIRKIRLYHMPLIVTFLILGLGDHYLLTLHQNMLLAGAAVAIYSFSKETLIS